MDQKDPEEVVRYEATEDNTTASKAYLTCIYSIEMLSGRCGISATSFSQLTLCEGTRRYMRRSCYNNLLIKIFKRWNQSLIIIVIPLSFASHQSLKLLASRRLNEAADSRDSPPFWKNSCW